MFQTDPQRTYLTGHSMGGHGTWQIGVNFPDRFAAIAPCAGWSSFFSYGGGRMSENENPFQKMLFRGASSSNTLELYHTLYFQKTKGQWQLSEKPSLKEKGDFDWKD